MQDVSVMFSPVLVISLLLKVLLTARSRIEGLQVE